MFLIITATVTISKAQTGVTSYPLPSGIIAGYVHDLKVDASGNKWIGFQRNGIGKFDGSTWTLFDTINSGIPSNYVNSIAFDASNNLWIGTIKGLSKFDGSSWTNYNVINSGLPDDSVYCITINGTDIWVGTKNGLAKFNGSSWTVFTTASGLTSNLVQCIAVESSGDVWVGTNNGLCKKSGSTWTNFNSTNPYMVNFYNIVGLYIDSSNDKWMSIKGSFGNTVYKLEGTSIIPLLTVFPMYSLYLGYAPYSICRGPMGGVAFYGGGGLNEIVGNQIYKYNLAGSDFNAYDPTSGKIWSTSKLVGSIDHLYSFDHTAYSGSPLVIPDNYQFSHLNINMVDANIGNRGDLFAGYGGYEVPKGSGRAPIFASGLWIGGIDNGGSLHQAAMTYRQTGNDYWPGPLDTISGTIDSAISVNYDKIWKVERFKIEEFRYMFAIGAVASGAYTVDNDILTWPTTGSGNISRNLAPFVDVNHDGLYNPLVDGDYPDIKGDEMCFWIFNDNLYAHTETGGLPLKIEVHASAYAYSCPSIADSLKVLNYTTFYNFKIFNRSTEDYHQTYLGIWEDGDLGSPLDDYVGCTPAKNYGSIFNGDEVDEVEISSIPTYGIAPPMVSSVILNGPLAVPGDGIDNDNDGTIDESGEKNLMTGFMYFKNDNTTTGNPNFANDFYNYLRNTWLDSTHVTYGGLGHGGTIPYNFMYDGALDALDATSGWSEATAGNTPADRRFVTNCGPFDLNSHESVDFDYAIVYTRDTASAYTIQNLYHKNKEDVMRIQQWYAVDSFPSCIALNVGINEPAKTIETIAIYPNPSDRYITINYPIESKHATIKLYDATGRLIWTKENIQTTETKLEVYGLENGLYLLTIQDGNKVSCARFVKQ